MRIMTGSNSSTHPSTPEETKTCRMKNFYQIFLLLAIFTLTTYYIVDFKRFGNNILSRKSEFVEDFQPLCIPLNRSERPNAPSVVQPSDSCYFCLDRHLKEGRFYNFSTSSLRFFAYSAFYDDRPSMLSDPVIRIIAISDNVGHLLRPNKTLGLFCHLFHPKGVKRVALINEARSCGPGYGLNGRGADPYVYTCPTEGVVPHSLSIVGGSDAHVSSCMPVEFPRRPEKQKDFVICVPVSYGNINPYRIIEWLEMQKILGVNSVAVYDLYLGGPALRVLGHYVKEGFVELRKIDRVYPHEGPLHILDLAISLNDCLYRHMYEFKRIIINDFDEFIKPLKHENLQELVGYLEKNINTSSNYVFRNSYFFLESPPDTNFSTRFTFLRYRKKAAVSEMWHRVKPVIVTMSCTHVFSHLCLGATTKYTNLSLVESIDPEIALTQHYRGCPLGGPACKNALKTVKQDDSILIYKNYLIDKITEKITAITGNASIEIS